MRLNGILARVLQGKRERPNEFQEAPANELLLCVFLREEHLQYLALFAGRLWKESKICLDRVNGRGGFGSQTAADPARRPSENPEKSRLWVL